MPKNPSFVQTLLSIQIGLPAGAMVAVRGFFVARAPSVAIPLPENFMSGSWRVHVSRETLTGL